MGNRFSAIAARRGDDGTTGLGGVSHVSKADRWVAAMGELDELGSAVGKLIASGLPVNELGMPSLLANIQQDLLDLGGELSIPGNTLLKGARVAVLDEWLKTANSTLPRLQELIRPGESVAAGQAHRCRTVCRRAERTVVALGHAQSVRDPVRQYLNRLSDLFFVIARVLNHRSAGAEHQCGLERGSPVQVFIESTNYESEP